MEMVSLSVFNLYIKKLIKLPFLFPLFAIYINQGDMTTEQIDTEGLSLEEFEKVSLYFSDMR
jgi:hypothetical protein